MKLSKKNKSINRHNNNKNQIKSLIGNLPTVWTAINKSTSSWDTADVIIKSTGKKSAINPIQLWHQSQNQTSTRKSNAKLAETGSKSDRAMKPARPKISDSEERETNQASDADGRGCHGNGGSSARIDGQTSAIAHRIAEPGGGQSVGG